MPEIITAKHPFPDIFLYDLDALINRNEELRRHSYSVGTYAKQIYLCLPDEEKKKFGAVSSSDIECAGRYHDIGKTFINIFYPNLLKKEHWESLDRVIIREHVLVGTCILYIFAVEDGADVESKQFALLHDACLYHHERNDGSGYLRIKKIPPIGQLIAIADCFAAGIEDRVYKLGSTPDEMIDELVQMPLNQTYVKALKESL